MPLLSRETDLFPDELLDPTFAPWGDERAWRVAHTLPRREKDLARRLLQREIPFYLPQFEQKGRSPAGRQRVSYLPLFPNYLFLRAADEERHAVLETGCVARLLDVPDAEQLLFDLRQVQRVLCSETPVRPEPQLAPGTPVRVTCGPFMGFEGRVLKHHSGDRLLVLINYLQQGISVSLEGCEIEAI